MGGGFSSRISPDNDDEGGSAKDLTSEELIETLHVCRQLIMAGASDAGSSALHSFCFQSLDFETLLASFQQVNGDVGVASSKGRDNGEINNRNSGGSDNNKSSSSVFLSSSTTATLLSSSSTGAGAPSSAGMLPLTQAAREEYVRKMQVGCIRALTAVCDYCHKRIRNPHFRSRVIGSLMGRGNERQLSLLEKNRTTAESPIVDLLVSAMTVGVFGETASEVRWNSDRDVVDMAAQTTKKLCTLTRAVRAADTLTPLLKACASLASKRYSGGGIGFSYEDHRSLCSNLACATDLVLLMFRRQEAQRRSAATVEAFEKAITNLVRSCIMVYESEFERWSKNELRFDLLLLRHVGELVAAVASDHLALLSLRPSAVQIGRIIRLLLRMDEIIVMPPLTPSKANSSSNNANEVDMMGIIGSPNPSAAAEILDSARCGVWMIASLAHDHLFVLEKDVMRRLKQLLFHEDVQMRRLVTMAVARVAQRSGKRDDERAMRVFFGTMHTLRRGGGKETEIFARFNKKKHHHHHHHHNHPNENNGGGGGGASSHSHGHSHGGRHSHGHGHGSGGSSPTSPSRKNNKSPKSKEDEQPHQHHHVLPPPIIPASSPREDRGGIGGVGISSSPVSGGASALSSGAAFGFLLSDAGTAPFARIPSLKSRPNDPDGVVFSVRALLEDVWRIPPPNLIFSIVGGTERVLLPMQLQRHVMSSLMKVCALMDAWIITAGLDAGMMRIIGEAAANIHSNVPVIGIAPWRAVLNNDKLELGRGNEAARLKIAYHARGPRALNSNHTHFILVDDSSGDNGEDDASILGRGGSDDKDEEKSEYASSSLDDKFDNNYRPPNSNISYNAIPKPAATTAVIGGTSLLPPPSLLSSASNTFNRSTSRLKSLSDVGSLAGSQAAAAVASSIGTMVGDLPDVKDQVEEASAMAARIFALENEVSDTRGRIEEALCVPLHSRRQSRQIAVRLAACEDREEALFETLGACEDEEANAALAKFTGVVIAATEAPPAAVGGGGGGSIARRASTGSSQVNSVSRTTSNNSENNNVVNSVGNRSLPPISGSSSNNTIPSSSNSAVNLSRVGSNERLNHIAEEEGVSPKDQPLPPQTRITIPLGEMQSDEALHSPTGPALHSQVATNMLSSTSRTASMRTRLVALPHPRNQNQQQQQQKQESAGDINDAAPAQATLIAVSSMAESSNAAMTASSGSKETHVASAFRSPDHSHDSVVLRAASPPSQDRSETSGAHGSRSASSLDLVGEQSDMRSSTFAAARSSSTSPPSLPPLTKGNSNENVQSSSESTALRHQPSLDYWLRNPAAVGGGVVVNASAAGVGGNDSTSSSGAGGAGGNKVLPNGNIVRALSPSGSSSNLLADQAAAFCASASADVMDGGGVGGGGSNADADCEDEETATIPMIVLLLQGDSRSFRTIHDAAHRGHPIIVVEGSGGVADILVDAHRSFLATKAKAAERDEEQMHRNNRSGQRTPNEGNTPTSGTVSNPGWAALGANSRFASNGRQNQQAPSAFTSVRGRNATLMGSEDDSADESSRGHGHHHHPARHTHGSNPFARSVLWMRTKMRLSKAIEALLDKEGLLLNTSSSSSSSGVPSALSPSRAATAAAAYSANFGNNPPGGSGGGGFSPSGAASAAFSASGGLLSNHHHNKNSNNNGGASVNSNSVMPSSASPRPVFAMRPRLQRRDTADAAVAAAAAAIALGALAECGGAGDDITAGLATRNTSNNDQQQQQQNGGWAGADVTAIGHAHVRALVKLVEDIVETGHIQICAKGEDIQHSVLATLLKSKPNQALLTAIRLNRPLQAKDALSRDGISPEEINDALLLAMRLNRTEMVQLLLHHGADLRRFGLWSDGTRSGNEKVTQARELFDTIYSWSENDPRSPYLRDILGHGRASTPETRSKALQAIIGDGFQGAHEQLGAIDNLLLWAVVSNRFELALLFWSMTIQSVRVGLVAVHIWRKLARVSTVSGQQADRMTIAAMEFERILRNMIDSMFKKDRELTLYVLHGAQWELWGKTNIDIAVLAKCDTIMELAAIDEALIRCEFSHTRVMVPGTQVLFTRERRVWALGLMFVTSMICPFTLPLFFSIKHIPDPLDGAGATGHVAQRKGKKRRANSAALSALDGGGDELAELIGYEGDGNNNEDDADDDEDEDDDVNNEDASASGGVGVAGRRSRRQLRSLGDSGDGEDVAELFKHGGRDLHAVPLSFVARLFKLLSLFFRTVATHLALSTLSHIVLLLLMIAVFTSDTGPSVSQLSASKIVLDVWFFALFIEELIQMTEERADVLEAGIGGEDSGKVAIRIEYFRSTWNVIDILHIITYVVGVILLEADCAPASRFLLALCILLGFLRLLNVLVVVREAGTMVVAIAFMLKDILGWVFIFAVVAIGFAFAFQILAGPENITHPLTWLFDRTLRDDRDFFITVTMPFWQLFGDPRMDDPVVAAGGTSSLIFLGVFLLLSNALLFNLLIAKMAVSFEDIRRRTKSTWMYQRYEVTADFQDTPALVPPVSLLYRSFQLLRLILAKLSNARWARFSKSWRRKDAGVSNKNRRAAFALATALFSEVDRERFSIVTRQQWESAVARADADDQNLLLELFPEGSDVCSSSDFIVYASSIISENVTRIYRFVSVLRSINDERENESARWRYAFQFCSAIRYKALTKRGLGVQGGERGGGGEGGGGGGGIGKEKGDKKEMPKWMRPVADRMAKIEESLGEMSSHISVPNNVSNRSSPMNADTPLAPWAKM